MPSWKRVIVSGSDAVLTSVTTTAGFTGSLSGSATSAISSSYALTASFALNGGGGAAFPFTGSALITGSLRVTGSLDLVYAGIGGGISVTGHFPRLRLINSGSGALGAGGSITTQDNNFATKSANAEVFSVAAVDANSSIVGAIIFKKASSSTTNISFFNSGTEGAFYISGSGDIGIGKTTPGAKLDVSGSAIISGSLTVTAGIIGSLQGTAATASYFSGSISNAIFATSASFATTASFTPNAIVTASVSLNTITFTKGNGTTFPITVNTGSGGGGGGGAAFPYTGSAIVSGSLTVTGSLFVQDFGKTNINSSNRQLYDAGPVMPPGASSRLSVDWNARTLTDTNNTTSIDWQNYTLGDYGGTAVNWNARTLIRSGNVIVDWRTQQAYDITTSQSINWNDRELWDGDPAGIGYNTASLDWNNRIAKDANALPSIDWGERALFDNGGGSALHWKFRSLYTPNTTTALNWNDDTYLDSNVYQRDYKSAAIQDAVSSIYNNPGRSYLGDVIEVGNPTPIDITVTEGMLVYLDNTGVWYPVNQAAQGATKLLGIAHNVGYSGAGTGWILLEGHVVIDDTSTSGPYVASAGYGLPIYIKDTTTTGQMSTSVPTTTGGPNIIRILGHCYHQDVGTATQWMMKFRPSNDWVEI